MDYKKIISDFTYQNFNVKFNGSIRINPELKTIGARVLLDKNCVEISPRIINSSYYDKEAFKKILQHEALHYALFCLNIQYEDHTPIFESFLKKYKLPTSDPASQRYGKTINKFLCFDKGEIYTCPECHKIIYKKINNRIINVNSHNHNCDLIQTKSNHIPLYINQYL